MVADRKGASREVGIGFAIEGRVGRLSSAMVLLAFVAGRPGEAWGEQAPGPQPGRSLGSDPSARDRGGHQYRQGSSAARSRPPIRKLAHSPGVPGISLETPVTETIYRNQNPAPRDVPASRDHSGFNGAGRSRVDGDLLEGTLRNRKRVPSLVIAQYAMIRPGIRKGPSGKNGGCS
jgi:hypothetical protein